MKRRLLATLLLAAGCSSQPGEITYRLLWPTDADAPAQVYLRGQVVLGNGEGVVQAPPVGPIDFGSVASLQFDRVPHGTGHVARIEVTESIDADRALYYGVSEPFDLAAGDVIEVAVPLQFRPPPSVTFDEAAVRVLSATGHVPAPGVMLELRTDTAVEVQLSNRPDFVGASQTMPLSQATSGGTCPSPDPRPADDPCVYTLAWDLDRGRADAPCEDSDVCPRDVFARFIDANGFRSAVASTAVNLDTRTPSIVEQVVNPATLQATGEATLQFSMQERIVARQLILSSALERVELVRVFPESDEDLSSNFTYKIRPRDGQWPSAVSASEMGLTVDATDRAGNRTAPPVSLTEAPTVDGQVPQVTNVRLEPALLGGSVRQTTLHFTLSEMPGPDNVEIATSPIPDPAGGADQGAETVDPAGCQVTPAGEDFEYTCTLDLSAYILDGLAVDVPVRVTATDLAGNAGSGIGTVRLDFVGPQALDPAGVLFVPGPGNPLALPTRAKVGTEIRAQVQFTEPLDTAAFPPRMEARLGDATLSFALVEAANNVATFTASVGAAVSEGIYAPRIEAQDLAGNRAVSTFGAPAIVIDTTPDGLVVDQRKVSFVRAIVANAAPEDLVDDQGRVQYTLPPGPNYFAVAPGDPLEPTAHVAADAFTLGSGGIPASLLFWGDLQGTSALGTAQPEPDGTWRRDALRLANQDAQRVYVVGVDEAGNLSPAVLIENIWVIATPARSVVGLQPHGFTSSVRAGPPLAAQQAETSTTVDAPDGQGLRVRAEYTWQAKLQSETIVGRVRPSYGYDHGRGHVLMFGGREENETYVLDGAGWRQLNPPNPPVNRGYAAPLAYDTARGRLLMYGGFNSQTGPFNELLAWDGERWSVLPTGPGPGPQLNNQISIQRQGLTYDSFRDRVVLFGSTLVGTATVTETWEHDGSAWHLIPTATTPPARQSPNLAYDPVRRRTVLLGGTTLDGQGLADTWEWDGQQWRDVTPAGGRGPGPLDFTGLNTGLDFNSKAERVRALYRNADPARLEEWHWDGATWTMTASSADTFPEPHTSVYDPERDLDVATTPIRFDIGPGGFRFAHDTWEWTGTRVREVRTEHPSARGNLGTAQLPGGRTVIFGGRFAGAAYGVYDETWVWDGAAWSDATSPLRPPAREGLAMAYDAARDRLVMFGGQTFEGNTGSYFADTWEWDGQDWREILPPVSPPARTDHVMAYDASRGQVVLHGGLRGRTATSTVVINYGDTWAFDGTTWTALTATTTPASNHSIAFDGARNELVLYDGGASDIISSGPFSTYRGDGTTWTLGALNSAPGNRPQPGLVFDARRARVVMFGGGGLNIQRDSIWEWDGQQWRDASTPFIGAPRRAFFAMAYRPEDDRSVVFGGFQRIFTGLDDTWELVPPTLPAVQLTTNLPAEMPREAIRDVRVRGFCAGRAEDAGGAQDGATLMGWIEGRWQPLASNSAGVGAPAANRLLDWQPSLSTDTSTATLPRRILGPNKKVYVQCRPNAGSGGGFAEVDVDYLEVRVKYQVQ